MAVLRTNFQSIIGGFNASPSHRTNSKASFSHSTQFQLSWPGWPARIGVFWKILMSRSMFLILPIMIWTRSILVGFNGMEIASYCHTIPIDVIFSFAWKRIPFCSVLDLIMRLQWYLWSGWSVISPDKTALLSPVRYSRLSLTYLPVLAFWAVHLGRKVRRRGDPRWQT